MRRKRSMAALKREAFKAWGAAILKRDPSCRVCRFKPSKHPHHLFPRSRYRHLWFDLRNGAGLCIGCHYEIHYSPISPIMALMAESKDRLHSLTNDSIGGRRKNPYKRGELENIIVALKGA